MTVKAKHKRSLRHTLHWWWVIQIRYKRLYKFSHLQQIISHISVPILINSQGFLEALDLSAYWYWWTRTKCHQPRFPKLGLWTKRAYSTAYHNPSVLLYKKCFCGLYRNFFVSLGVQCLSSVSNLSLRNINPSPTHWSVLTIDSYCPH